MSSAELPSRREILSGKLAVSGQPEGHVSSLVVHRHPDKAASVRSALESMPGLEIHAEAGAKLVVTLVTDNEAEIVTRLNAISLLEGVMSAALVFHHVEAAESGGEAVDQG